jgi:sigma-B regulation protein RsbU (phosphoserine phosphatase)
LLPTIPGVEICARYRPSGLGNLVGGDFYDIFPNGNGGWVLLVGDACGIGPEAAGLAGIARYTARALAETSVAPAAMLGHLNRALLRAAPDDRFCTAVILGFEMGADGLAADFASAGHPAVYKIAADGSVSVASESTGMILGVVEDASVGEASLELSPGEALVLYTDGVTEARNDAGEQFGDERLVAVLEEAVGRSAEGIARRVELAVIDHRGPRNSDDVAIVVLRVAPREA